MIVLYAKITGVHGIKGEIEMSFPDKEYFNSLPYLNKDTPIIILNNQYTVLNVKKKNKAFIFSLKEIDNIDKAKELVGQDIFIDSSYLPVLDEDTFYRAELIGYKVLDRENNIVGEIINLYSIPANEVFEIALEDNKKKIVSIPFVNAYFGKANKNEKTIIILVDIKLFEDNN